MKAGRFLSSLRAKMTPLGSARCSEWGCLAPVGPGSVFGPGPICMACGLRLRAETPRGRRIKTK